MKDELGSLVKNCYYYSRMIMPYTTPVIYAQFFNYKFADLLLPLNFNYFSAC